MRHSPKDPCENPLPGEDYCEDPYCQNCCTHDECDHFICNDCGKELEPSDFFNEDSGQER